MNGGWGTALTTQEDDAPSPEAMPWRRSEGQPLSQGRAQCLRTVLHSPDCPETTTPGAGPVGAPMIGRAPPQSRNTRVQAPQARRARFRPATAGGRGRTGGTTDRVEHLRPGGARL